MHTAQSQAVRRALSNVSFWSSWLPTTNSALVSKSEGMLKRQCTMRLRSWRPRICTLHNVYVIGAAQILLNRTVYFGSSQRIISTAPTADFTGRRVAIEASLEHVVLSRNEYGAGYYHFLFDTLASISFVWPSVKSDPQARVLINPCSTGRDHVTGPFRTTAPSLDSAQQCKMRSYAAELITLLGLRVFRWPYTRQRVSNTQDLPVPIHSSLDQPLQPTPPQSPLHVHPPNQHTPMRRLFECCDIALLLLQQGPLIAAAKATFMCPHPFHATYHRQFWYSHQLRIWLHTAFRLPYEGTSRPSGHRLQERLIVLVNRNECEQEGCDISRGVHQQRRILLALRRAFPRDQVVEFFGTEPIAEQALLR
jgi:hypothetical protein